MKIKKFERLLQVRNPLIISDVLRKFAKKAPHTS